MNSRLSRTKNWPELAALSRYRVKDLAELCNVSRSQLGRFFRNPKVQMHAGPYEALALTGRR